MPAVRNSSHTANTIDFLSGDFFMRAFSPGDVRAPRFVVVFLASFYFVFVVKVMNFYPLNYKHHAAAASIVAY